MIFLLTVVAGLTATFCLALASFAWEDIVLGALLSSLLVAVFRRQVFPTPLPRNAQAIRVLVFIPQVLAMLVVDILKGTWLVTTFVVGLRKLEHPGIVKIPIGHHSLKGAGVVGFLVTISPGSFVVDIDWEGRSMLIHYMDASDPAQLRRDVEKYYRLWEHGARLPRDPRPETRLEDRP
jgi:multisubunit Na+/H+ antiporter MnhE subunit